MYVTIILGKLRNSQLDAVSKCKLFLFLKSNEFFGRIMKLK